eukprot:5141477-Prorocentrum_lima.AAC.1
MWPLLGKKPQRADHLPRSNTTGELAIVWDSSFAAQVTIWMVRCGGLHAISACGRVAVVDAYGGMTE